MSEGSRTRFMAGAAWMVGWRWVTRLLGLLSTIILARMLVPEDFGIIAMAAVVVGFLESLSIAEGVASVVIRKAELDADDLDTAWTIRFLQRQVLALLLIPGAYLTAAFFGEPRVVEVMFVLAALVSLTGFENLAAMMFRRELRFDRYFLFGVLNKLAGMLSSILAALVLHNYWALVVGNLGVTLSTIVGSYVLHAHRPRFTLRRFAEFWSVSQWILFAEVVQYLKVKIDRIAVGGALGTADMGRYSVGVDIGVMPTAEIAVPVSNSLLPNFSRIIGDEAALRTAFLRVLTGSLMLSVPAGLGTAVLAHELVVLALGDRWVEIVPIVQWIAVYGLVRTMIAPLAPLLTAIGETRMVLVISLVSFALMVPIIVVAATHGSVETIAGSRLGAICLIVPTVFAVAARAFHIPWQRLLTAVYRPLLAGVLMVGVLSLLNARWELGPLLRLLVDLPIGAAVYLGGLVLLCRLSGVEQTTEYHIYRLLRMRISAWWHRHR